MPVKIAVDPGHGMSNASPGVFDPGAEATDSDGDHFAEADIALDYGRTLRFLLRQKDIEVFMTRTSNSDPAPVGKRAPRAEDADCTHFVALHLNSAGSSARGVEVLYRRDANEPLAAKISAAVAEAVGFRDRGSEKRTDLAVLRFDEGPSVLVELGFISNKADRDVLVNRDNRIAICNAIIDALDV